MDALERFKSAGNLEYLADYTGVEITEVRGRIYDFIAESGIHVHAAGKFDEWATVRRLNADYADYLSRPQIIGEYENYHTYELLKHDKIFNPNKAEIRMPTAPEKRLERYTEIPVWQRTKIPLGEFERGLKVSVNDE
jgi:hypothetical protein